MKDDNENEVDKFEDLKLIAYLRRQFYFLFTSFLFEIVSNQKAIRS